MPRCVVERNKYCDTSLTIHFFMIGAGNWRFFFGGCRSRGSVVVKLRTAVARHLTIPHLHVLLGFSSIRREDENHNST